MKLFRTTAFATALMTAASSLLTSPAHAGGWNWGGWGWGGVVAAGVAPDGTSFGYAPNVYSPPYDYPGYPAYNYGYGTGSLAYGGYRYTNHPVVRRHAAAVAVRRH